MNRTRLLCLSSVFVPVLCSTIAPADSIAYRPAAGTKVSRAWVVKQDLTLDEMNITMNGQPLPIDLQMSMDMTSEMTIDVSDELVALKDGKLTELRRTYDKLALDGQFAVEMAMMPDGGMEQSMAGKSALEGKTVKFAWDGEASEYDRTYHESAGEEELLKGLDEDMDLRGIAPGKEVSTGDTWTIDVASLRPLLLPGGDTGIRPESSESEMGGMMPGMNNYGDMSKMLGELLEGEATAEYMGIQDVEGGKYAVIKLKLEISTNNDMADELADMAKEIPGGMGEFEFEHIDMEFSIEAEGTVLWDASLGMLRRVDLSGKVKMNMDMAMKIKAQGQDMAMEQSMVMSGTISIKQDVTKD